MTHKDSPTVIAGFLPLVDAALLIATREKGFAETEGLELKLVRETSWANIRDRMAVGHFQCAHILAPMPIAAMLGLSPMPVDIIAPMALGLGGNAITVSNALYDAMNAVGELTELEARQAGLAIGRVIEARRRNGHGKLVLAVVHSHSAHNYDLRYWLYASGIDPDRDVEIVIVPPPFMPDALANGRIDGFCVGEPWNSVAAQAAQGAIITSKSSIWRSSPEKVLGVEASFAQTRPDVLDALIRSVCKAAAWCADAANCSELADIMSRPDYLDVAGEVILPALTGTVVLGRNRTISDPDFFMPFARAATFPWKSHAAWFYSQMVRAHQTVWNPDDAMNAAHVYRPDIYRRALAGLDIFLPSADWKVEGALSQTRQVSAVDGSLQLGPDGFFDGRIFDPEMLEAYVKEQAAGPSS
ncbi:MAG: ABC transporter substrate-binding protein [Hyphomicrobiales bacterium]|nr:ABC transporter substrate-binding protein [Hyphomicrobiales bacterium]